MRIVKNASGAEYRMDEWKNLLKLKEKVTFTIWKINIYSLKNNLISRCSNNF